MIRVERLQEPDVLRRKGLGWAGELCQARRAYYEARQEFEKGLRPEAPRYPKAEKGRYAHPEVRRRLREMFDGKCAYCEATVEAVTHSHVEHFRPQSVYPRLAYTWSNLLQACPRCNGDHKGDRFPRLDETLPEEDPADPSALGDDDENALLDPCRDDPEEHLTFVDERIACRTRRGVTTRQVCGLDRPDLDDARRLWMVRAVDVAAKSYQLAVERRNREQEEFFAGSLRDLLHPACPFVAMARARLAFWGIEVGVERVIIRPLR